MAAGLAKTNLRSSRTRVAIHVRQGARVRDAVATGRTSINFNGSNVVIAACRAPLAGVGTVDYDRRGGEALRGLRRHLDSAERLGGVDPRGFGSLGADAKVRRRRNSKRDSVMIDELGRVIQ